MFTQEDVNNFHIIFHLVKERGFTLQGAREKLRNNKDEAAANMEMIRSLTRLKEFLLNLKKEL